MRFQVLTVFALVNLSALLLYVSVLNATGGIFLYVLDDPYIHLKIAKNFSETGVFGIENEKFSSASSSPFWTLLLSLLYGAGLKSSSLPLFLNFIIMQLTAYCLIFHLREAGFKEKYWSSITIFIIASLPFFPLVFNGMEHLLHIILTFFCIRSLYWALVKDKFSDYLLFCTILFFCCGVRYESIAAGFTSFIFLILHRKHWQGLFALLSAFLPVTVFGIFSTLNGWGFFPISVSVKTFDYNSLLYKNPLEVTGVYFYIDKYLSSIFQNSLALTEVIFGLFIFRHIIKESVQKFLKERTVEYREFFLLFFIFLFSAHIIFAKTGWFFRYEAYIIFLFWMTVVLWHSSISELFQNLKKGGVLKKAIFILIAVIPAFNIAVRSVLSNAFSYRAFQNMYQQDWQMMKFVKKHMPNANIAVNDIGLVSYYTDAKITDLWGLSHLDIADAKLRRKYNTEFINETIIKEKVIASFVYDKWFEKYGGVPKSWKKICDWKIKNNVVAGDAVLSIYSTMPEYEGETRKSLKAFLTEMPDETRKISVCF